MVVETRLGTADVNQLRRAYQPDAEATRKPMPQAPSLHPPGQDSTVGKERVIYQAPNTLPDSQQPRKLGSLHTQRPEVSTQEAHQDGTIDWQVREGQLVPLARQQNHEAVNALFTHYEGPLLQLIVGRIGNPYDAQDILQEVFLRAYVALPITTEDLQIRPWLLAIARNLCIDYRRAHGTVSFVPLEIPPMRGDPRQFLNGTSEPDPKQEMQFASQDEHTDPEGVAIAKEEQDTVDRVLSKMHPHYRDLLVLQYYYRLSRREIAALTKKTEIAVRDALSLARRQLRTKYQEVTGITVTGLTKSSRSVSFPKTPGKRAEFMSLSRTLAGLSKGERAAFLEKLNPAQIKMLIIGGSLVSISSLTPRGPRRISQLLETVRSAGIVSIELDIANRNGRSKGSYIPKVDAPEFVQLVSDHS